MEADHSCGHSSPLVFREESVIQPLQHLKLDVRRVLGGGRAPGTGWVQGEAYGRTVSRLRRTALPVPSSIPGT